MIKIDRETEPNSEDQNDLEKWLGGRETKSWYCFRLPLSAAVV